MNNRFVRLFSSGSTGNRQNNGADRLRRQARNGNVAATDRGVRARVVGQNAGDSRRRADSRRADVRSQGIHVGHVKKLLLRVVDQEDVGRDGTFETQRVPLARDRLPQFPTGLAQRTANGQVRRD